MAKADSASQEAAAAGSNKYASPAYVQAREQAWGADAGQRFFYRGLQLADEVSASVRHLAGDHSYLANFAVSPKDNQERMWQGHLLNEMFGNPFRPAGVDRSWLTPTVLALARAAYDERELHSAEVGPARLAVLSDALEEAGCTDTDLLSHLRSPGPHVRGCWVVDLLLGKD
jgi:hypothetical protein